MVVNLSSLLVSMVSGGSGWVNPVPVLNTHWLHALCFVLLLVAVVFAWAILYCDNCVCLREGGRGGETEYLFKCDRHYGVFTICPFDFNLCFIKI